MTFFISQFEKYYVYLHVRFTLKTFHAMKRLLLSILTLTLCCWAYDALAQTEVSYQPILEPTNYEQVIYLDSMPSQLSPDLFLNIYYHNLDMLDYRGSLTIDDTNRRTVARVRSKEAKRGYLYVNSLIMDYISSQDLNLDRIKVSYVYNSVIVNSETDVMRVIRLRRKSIKSSDILFDEQLGLITAYVTTRWWVP